MRHPAAPSGGRDAFEFDEDALARTGQRSIDDILLESPRHPGQAARAARVVEGDAFFGDIGDAVLELNEHVRPVIEAQAVTGAQVLIDPHPHDLRRYKLVAIGAPPVRAPLRSGPCPPPTT